MSQRETKQPTFLDDYFKSWPKKKTLGPKSQTARHVSNDALIVNRKRPQKKNSHI